METRYRVGYSLTRTWDELNFSLAFPSHTIMTSHITITVGDKVANTFFWRGEGLIVGDGTADDYTSLL